MSDRNDQTDEIATETTDETRMQIEAAVYRRLVEHLRAHTEVQNIDLMNLADFCRNCLSKWYLAEAAERGFELDYEQAREIIYGMPYSEWKARHQKPMTPRQREADKARRGA